MTTTSTTKTTATATATTATAKGGVVKITNGGEILRWYQGWGWLTPAQVRAVEIRRAELSAAADQAAAEAAKKTRKRAKAEAKAKAKKNRAAQAAAAAAAKLARHQRKLERRLNKKATKAATHRVEVAGAILSTETLRQLEAKGWLRKPPSGTRPGDWGRAKRHKARNPQPRVNLQSQRVAEEVAEALQGAEANEVQDLEAKSPDKWESAIPFKSPIYGGSAWQALAAQAKVEARVQARWEAGQLPWQQALALLRAKFGFTAQLTQGLTRKEWESKTLDSKRAKALGLRSPKLSKALAAFGVPEKEISTLLSAKSGEQGLEVAMTQVLSDAKSCLDQGNSVYYSSCQATDPRAKYTGDGGHVRVTEDLPFIGKSLFLWVVGQPMNVDGKGYKARAKVRVMYEDETCQRVAALYIDRPYGQHQLLLSNLDELEAWWEKWCYARGLAPLPMLVPPVWNRNEGQGNDFQTMFGGRYTRKLFCPSAKDGYQDTLSQGVGGYDCFDNVSEKRNSLVNVAYQERPRFGGVYHCPLKAVEFNPQKGGLEVPAVKAPQQRPSHRTEPDFVAAYQVARSLGAGKDFDRSEAAASLYHFQVAGKSFTLNFESAEKYFLRPEGGEVVLGTLYGRRGITVARNCPELGLFSADYCPEGIVVSYDNPAEGYAVAVPLPEDDE